MLSVDEVATILEGAGFEVLRDKISVNDDAMLVPVRREDLRRGDVYFCGSIFLTAEDGLSNLRQRAETVKRQFDMEKAKETA